MYQRIFVPVDGSQRSWDVVDAAAALAGRWDCPLEIVSVVRFESVRAQVESEMRHQIETADWETDATVTVLAGIDRSPAEFVTELVNDVPGSLIVMSTTGHGRSAAVLGSTANEIIAHTTTPVLLYGPHANTGAPAGDTLVLAVDGTSRSEEAVGLAGAWSIGLHVEPWVVTVVNPDVEVSVDAHDVVAQSVARHLGDLTGKSVQFETLHDKRPAVALTDFASSMNAALLIEATHAREGADRLRHGSVAMASVRHARLPVLLMHGVGSRLTA
jgi:nucleotide-binding universal stress UspA family protein